MGLVLSAQGHLECEGAGVLGPSQWLGVCWHWSGPLSRGALAMKSGLPPPHDSVCPTGQLCRWKTCFQPSKLRSTTQCLGFLNLCFLLRVQLVSKECNHCVTRGWLFFVCIGNFIKGLLCCWQWFCLSFWGHPCKIHSTYIGSWCVHGISHGYKHLMSPSWLVWSFCMLRYVSLYSMLPSLYITYITYFSGFGACWWNSTPLDWFSSHRDAPGPTHHHAHHQQFSWSV